MNRPTDIQPRIHQIASGKGVPLVVLHGLFGDADNFRSIALHLERYFHVIRLDLPGHGQSATLDDLSIGSVASAVSEHLSDAGIHSYHLLGHSLGGKVAMQMAGNAADQTIGKLIIVDIAPRLYPPHHTPILDALSNLPLEEISSRGDAEKRLRQHIPDAGIRGFLLKSLQRGSENDYRWRFDLAGLSRDYDAMRQPPEFKHPVFVPTLFIKGAGSDYIGPQDELPIRTHFKDPHFKEIGGTGHWPHAEKPALFQRICMEFLNRAPDTA